MHIRKLLNNDIKGKEKRHIMRVQLGDYIKKMIEETTERTISQIKMYDLSKLPNFGLNFD